MKTLRSFLAFPVAILACLFFPAICFAILMQSPDQEPAGMEFIVPLFLSPIVSLAILLFLLPTQNRSNLLKSITGYSIFLAIGALIFSFLCALGQNTHALDYLYYDIPGIIVGALLAYLCIPLKCRGIPDE